MVRILIILLLFCSITARATTYQIANQSAFNSFNFGTLIAGDNVQFAKGQTFYGSITISQSGTAGNPITLSAYGTGTNPIITGFTTVTAWTNLGSNIWESTYAVSSLDSCNLVTIGGVNTQMGRFPNMNTSNGGYLIVETKNSNTFTNSTLTGTPNWTGAQAVFRHGPYTLTKSTIINHVSTTLTTQIDASAALWGFFIQSDARTLDQQNEWYYNNSTKKMRIYSTSQPTNVKVASVNTLLSPNGNYITVDGIDFSGSNKYAIFKSTHGAITLNNVIIKNCNISFSGINGIGVRYDYLTIENNTIKDSNSDAIDISYSNNVTVINNQIQNSGLLNGMGHPDVGSQGAIMARPCNNLRIEYNRIINTGLNGIYFYGNDILIKNNFIYTYCVTLDDGGGIYTYTGTGGAMTSNVKIQGNICVNGIGVVSGSNLSNPDPYGRPAFGIYLDEQSKNVDVFDNTIANNASSGILLNASAGYINVHRNTVYNNARQFHTTCWDIALKPTNNRLFGNILLSTTSLQKNLFFYGGDMIDVTDMDSNYYARPIDDYGTPSLYDKPIFYSGADYNAAFRTFEEWQIFSSQDVNSHKSPQAITSGDDFLFEYNATTSPKTVALSVPMIDMKGTKYAYNVILQPFTSVVLIPDNAPIFPPRPIAKNGKYLKSNGKIIMK